MYNRELKTKLLELSQTWSIISVTGPRQSGKTTLCKMAFPEYEYVNLERATTRALVEQDIEGFLLQYPNGLIIDEAQNLPELFSVLQVVVDENKSLRYVLSGSSDFLLMQNISQSLAGRVAVMRLLPLSLSELGADTSEDVNEQMWCGFYPAVWGDKKDPHTVYDSYVATYIQKDVRQIVNILHSHPQVLQRRDYIGIHICCSGTAVDKDIFLSPKKYHTCPHRPKGNF